jgi:hypothetical protein
MLRQPAVQRLGADAALRLMSACVEQQLRGELLLLRSQLSAGQQCVLDGAAGLQLLWLACEAQQWDMLN